MACAQGPEIGQEEAEQVLPRSTCALIKSFKLARVCPFFESCDLVIGETTCDGKKKAFEILDEQTPVYVIEIPQLKEARGRELWRQEVVRFMDRV